MLWICQGCTAAFSSGAARCPHCRGTEYREQGDEAGPVRSTVTGEPVKRSAGKTAAAQQGAATGG